MDVDLIFKIAAIGIIVSVLNQVLLHQSVIGLETKQGGAGDHDHFSRADCSVDDDD